MSAITLAELEAGFAKSNAPDAARAQAATVFGSVNVVAFDEAAARAFGRVQSEAPARGGAYDRQIAKTTAEDAGLSRRMEVLTSIAGVGRVVAAGLLADMPELGRVDGKAAASLVGVAP